MKSTKNKLIFISDLHMNNGFSFGPHGHGYKYAYTWMNHNIPKAASFLTWLGQRQDVAELIILGDLFDGWLCPMQQTPTKDFINVLNEPRNKPIIDALRALCQKGSGIQVSYVPGNHDMLLRNIFTPANGFQNLKFISTAPGVGLYRKNKVIFAEHGSRYCLFNAPDTWSHQKSHLPEGFFMTRVAADYTARFGKLLDFVQILQGIIKKGVKGNLPEQFFTAVQGRAVPASATFLMNGLDGFSPDPTCADVLRYYAAIYNMWDQRQDIVPCQMALIDDLGTLVPAASWIFLTGQPYSPKILIFGHTHNYGFYGFHPLLGAASSGCKEYEHIYANTGTWIDGKTCTYIEVDVNLSRGIYCVRGYSFKDPRHQTLRDEGFVR